LCLWQLTSLEITFELYITLQLFKDLLFSTKVLLLKCFNNVEFDVNSISQLI
jgi:hypothetical protein